MADSVQLTDLDVITRYSIAVRAATADRDELIETLRGDLAWLERGRTRTAASAPEEPETSEETPRRAPARRTATARTAPARTATARTASARTASPRTATARKAATKRTTATRRTSR